ncbi:MAG: hypothetical protein ACSHW0_01675 [Thalassotalea sp.]
MTFIRSLLLTCLFYSFFVFAEDEAEIELPPVDPAYNAIHPMVLVNKGSTIFAYYLSGYEKPSDVQLLYKLSVKNVALVQLVRDADLVIVKPEKFNLQHLMRGEKLAVSAEVYIGDYRTDGTIVYENVVLEFDKLLYARELNELEESNKKQTYEAISYNSKSDRLYLHHIQQAPSYAQLLHVDLTASCRNSFNASSAVPKESELLYKFINCGTLTPLYFDAGAYQKNSER